MRKRNEVPVKTSDFCGSQTWRRKTVHDWHTLNLDQWFLNGPVHNLHSQTIPTGIGKLLVKDKREAGVGGASEPTEEEEFLVTQQMSPGRQGEHCS